MPLRTPRIIKPRICDKRCCELDLYLKLIVSILVFVSKKIEARVAADEDLKLADLLKYYLRESQAAKV